VGDSVVVERGKALSRGPAVDRVHRIGQDRPVHITYLLTRNTVDHFIFDLLVQVRLVRLVLVAKKLHLVVVFLNDIFM